MLFGYDLSDKILSHIATCLKEMCGAYGFFVYKLKGHEFGILLNDWILDERRSELAILTVCNRAAEYSHYLGREGAPGLCPRGMRDRR